MALWPWLLELISAVQGVTLRISTGWAVDRGGPLPTA